MINESHLDELIDSLTEAQEYYLGQAENNPWHAVDVFDKYIEASRVLKEYIMTTEGAV